VRVPDWHFPYKGDKPDLRLLPENMRERFYCARAQA
jgi:hypothetical protein